MDHRVVCKLNESLLECSCANTVALNRNEANMDTQASVAMNCSKLREMLHLTICAGSSPSTSQESEASTKRHEKRDRTREQKREEREIKQ